MYLPKPREKMELLDVQGEKCVCGRPLVEYDLYLPRCNVHNRIRTCENEYCNYEVVLGSYDKEDKLILFEKPEKIFHECSW